jgi:hypothetical protein
MDIVFEELFEEREILCDLDDEFTGGQESEVDFLDDSINDSSLGL